MDDNRQRMTTAHPTNTSAAVTFGHSAAKKLSFQTAFESDNNQGNSSSNTHQTTGAN